AAALLVLPPLADLAPLGQLERVLAQGKAVARRAEHARVVLQPPAFSEDGDLLAGAQDVQLAAPVLLAALARVGVHPPDHAALGGEGLVAPGAGRDEEHADEEHADGDPAPHHGPASMSKYTSLKAALLMCTMQPSSITVEWRLMKSMVT